MFWLPVHVQLQVWKDELLLNEFPDDPSHLVSLHLHHRPRLDLLGHLGSWRGTEGECLYSLWLFEEVKLNNTQEAGGICIGSSEHFIT